MNRTRQANEHLEYQGILDEAPRLLTIGLDHVVNNSEVPKQSAREYYGRDDSHRKVTQALQNCATRVRTWGEKGGGCLRTEEKENHARRRPTSIYARMSAPDDKVITAFSASIGLKL